MPVTLSFAHGHEVPEGRRFEFRGTVQGVGFRPWAYRVAREHGVAGRVWNHAEGVTVEAFGPAAALECLERRFAGQLPPASSVREVRVETIPYEAAADFAIVDSAPGGPRRVSIPPDLATCPECAAEIRDPEARRRGYAFTNCTRCGPRFTIATGVPYDRAVTTMAPFAMCPACRGEYHDPGDRRFHAEPIACPACGPRLALLDEAGRTLPGDPLALAGAALLEGRTVAVKGLGGFHLAVDATSEAAVVRLRRRKRRDEKPFAVMVADLAAARTVAELSEPEAELLGSVERPIVLVRRRSDSGLAAAVAPDSPLVGLLLAYTPLHALLLDQVRRPLVMTSGNVSDEPIVHTDADAVARLGVLADRLLVHDRSIAARCDDSVARVVAGAPMLMRRSRGYVPRAVPLARGVARPVLGCGAHLKNAPCLAVGDAAYLGAHVGDLETEAACRALEEGIERLERLLDLRPEAIGHDAHPDYHSTAYARERPEAVKVAVQHHHAHVASAMAEHGLDGPVLGVAYDGTGYGDDGTAWGGELLLATLAGYERLATFRPLALAGGDLAIRQVWRIALALLDDAFDGAPPLDRLPVFAVPTEHELGIVRRMLVRKLNAPLARGVGRYFDAFGALGLGRASSAFEGQVALAWNLAAVPGAAPPYGFDVDWTARPWTVDLRLTTRQAVADLVAGRAAGIVSARFHETLVAATAALVRRAVGEHGRRPVALTGGCFQNPRLAQGVLAALCGELDVFVHREVPPGDGGIALGQALVADAVARESS